jgi:hypothetical protein
MSQMHKMPMFTSQNPKAPEMIEMVSTSQAIQEVDSSEKDEKYQSVEDLSKQYPFGFSGDPTDKKPYELASKCYFCQARFTVED